MTSKLLKLFTLCNILLAVGTAPTFLPNGESFDLKKEMDVFKEVLHKQLETAKVKIETARLKECEEIKDCINQKNLLRELKESIEGVNATMDSLFFKTAATLATATGEWRAEAANT